MNNAIALCCIAAALMLTAPPTHQRILAGNSALHPAGTSASTRATTSASVQSRSRLSLARGLIMFGAVFASVLVFLTIGQLTAAIAALIAAATVAHTAHDMASQRASKREEATVAAFLGVVSADLRAGANLPHALMRGADSLDAQAPADLRERLRTASVIATQGASVAQWLAHGGGTLGKIGLLCEVGERYGIPLAQLFEQSQARIDASRRHRAATAASLQGPQATALVLSCLPLAGIAMGTAMGARVIPFLFSGALGGLLLVAGIALTCAGFVWSRHLISSAAGA